MEDPPMRARLARLKNRPGPKRAGPFDSRVSSGSRDSSRAGPVPVGWTKRPSGVAVPPAPRGGGGGPAIGAFVIAAILLVSPVANGISDVSRAVASVVALVRLVVGGP